MCHFGLSVDSKRFLKAVVLKKHGDKSMIPHSWTPPPYDGVDDYIYEICEVGVLITLGSLNGEELQSGMKGEVECFDLCHCTGDAVLRYPGETGRERGNCKFLCLLLVMGSQCCWISRAILGFIMYIS